MSLINEALKRAEKDKDRRPRPTDFRPHTDVSADPAGPDDDTSVLNGGG
ncbi:hypothetical protein LCGC14_2839920, partial [marine sediment metagenome]